MPDLLLSALAGEVELRADQVKVAECRSSRLDKHDRRLKVLREACNCRHQQCIDYFDKFTSIAIWSGSIKDYMIQREISQCSCISQNVDCGPAFYFLVKPSLGLRLSQQPVLYKVHQLQLKRCILLDVRPQAFLKVKIQKMQTDISQT